MYSKYIIHGQPFRIIRYNFTIQIDRRHPYFPPHLWVEPYNCQQYPSIISKSHYIYVYGISSYRARCPSLELFETKIITWKIMYTKIFEQYESTEIWSHD